MKKPEIKSQYRQFRQPQSLSPELVEELKMLRALEQFANAATQQSAQVVAS